MFSKQIVFTLPAAIVLYEIFFYPPAQRKRTWIKKNKILFFVLSGLFLLIPVIYIFKGAHLLEVTVPSRSHQGDIITSASYLLTQLRVVPLYFWLMVFPVVQNFDYDFPLSYSLLEPLVVGGLLFLLGLMMMSWRLFRRRSIFGFCGLWIFLTLSVESTWIPIQQVIFEHRCYLPLVGFSLAAAFGLYTVVQRARTFALMSVSVIIALSVLTIFRNEVWRDEISLWSDVAKKSPQKGRPYIHLGTAYMMQEDDQMAYRTFSRGIEVDDQNFILYHNRAVALMNLKHYQRSLVDFNRADQFRGSKLHLYRNRGQVYSALGQETEAVLDYTQAITMDPHDAGTYVLRGGSYFQLQNYQEALEDFQKASSLGYAVASKDLETLRRLVAQ